MENDETYFDKIIENIKYPKCPNCGSHDILTNQFFAACLTNCGWIGDLSSAASNCEIIKSIFVTESFFNLINLGRNSIKDTAQSIAREKSLPGFHEDKNINAYRSFINQLNDYGEENNVHEFMSDRFLKVLKLYIASSMNRLCHLYSSNLKNGDACTIYRNIGANINSKISIPISDHFIHHSDENFMKKYVVSSSKEEKEDGNILVSVFNYSYGRPDTLFTREFTKNGAYIEDGKPSIEITNTSKIWQPFYWPAIDFSSSNLVRLAGVIQSGGDNITYIVNECMDTGSFSAGAYKRNTFSNEVNFIKSKADNAEEAIRKIRTSFEKLCSRSSESNQVIDFSWIKDWGYEYSIDKSVYEIVMAPFWGESLCVELLHLTGYSKDQLLEEMYQTIKKSNKQ